MITRMMLLAAPLIAALGGAPAAAQDAEQQWAPPAPQVREAMAKLDWLKGEWRGEGWRDGPDGREEFITHERVEPQVDGLVLLFHGRGWTVHEDGSQDEEASHVALGVFSYDAFRQAYVFDGYVKDGYQIRGNPTVGENEFRWAHPAGPNTEMRYHVRLSDDGDWLETGERCQSGGENEECTKFFEMRLDRIGEE